MNKFDVTFLRIGSIQLPIFPTKQQLQCGECGTKRKNTAAHRIITSIIHLPFSQNSRPTSNQYLIEIHPSQRPHTTCSMLKGGGESRAKVKYWNFLRYWKSEREI